MNRPWQADREISLQLAERLIVKQFPELAPIHVRQIGNGWDNTAVEVNDKIVFRFPRRRVAVGLLEVEIKVLPTIAKQVPLAIPVPTWIGEPTQEFDWPFAGYPLLVGTTACRAELTNEQRIDLAQPLAEFLCALHQIPSANMRTIGAPLDEWGRLDVANKTEDNIRQLADNGEVASIDSLMALLHEAPTDWLPADDTVVHGDLYARHILVDEHWQPSGIIDWGDIHVGDPAVDLAVAYSFIPPQGRDRFFATYGSVDDQRLCVARMRALASASSCVLYGLDTRDDVLLREGRRALELIDT